ncbi:MAG TPA: ATP-dependent zinc metalloprotease FtsH [Spirochaetota bacterium]|nr:ATP-dependent zinc metalloprotease FtsH [Spirochaetota bacterium]HQQ23004.1 ATP-dependent zinc metalloprotease FtsH [Spirochaetota bacterium]
MNKGFKQLALILLVVMLAVMIFTLDPGKDKKTEELGYNEFLQYVNDNRIVELTINENRIIEGAFLKDNAPVKFKTIIPYQDNALVQKLVEKNVKMKGKMPEEGLFYKFLMSPLPWLLMLVLLFFFLMCQFQSTGSKAMNFGKTRAKLHHDSNNKVTFDDVAGIDEAKGELSEIVDFLKKPEKYIKLGAKIPKGVLLVGPPGTGKTLLARAIAGEAGVKFFSISGSDFMEMFVGVGASRVRDLFDQGKKNSPCIIFIDEVDAIGRLRGAGLGGGHDEREQTLNQLLVEMDGFETNEGLIIIAATNRPDVLDPALLRPGRFDRQVIVDVPDVRGREKILAVHSKKIPLAKDVDLKIVARGTPGFTGADLANLINESAIMAARRNRSRVNMSDIDSAKDKIMMGPERKSMIITEKEKEITAYHEAGHALIGLLTDDNEDVHKVTIIPRGRALGLTLQLPHEEKYTHTKKYWIERISLLFGGHIAERLKFGDSSTGSSNDIERATQIAKRMVCEWGMSEKLGLMSVGSRNDQVFIGRDWVHEKNYSENTAQIIDEEIKSILSSCEKRATELISGNLDKFEKIGKYLIERETLNADDLALIMKGEDLPAVNGEEKVSSSSEEKETEDA